MNKQFSTLVVVSVIVVAGLLWYVYNQNVPHEPLVVDTNPVVVVPAPPPTEPVYPETDGSPPSLDNQPQPVVPPEEPVYPETDGSPPSLDNQPQPVVPPEERETPPLQPNSEEVAPAPFVWPNIEHKPVIVKPHKPHKPVVHKPKVKHKNKRKHCRCKEFCVAYKDKGYYYKLTPHSDW
jgi:hypothetical protein